MTRTDAIFKALKAIRFLCVRHVNSGLPSTAPKQVTPTTVVNQSVNPSKVKTKHGICFIVYIWFTGLILNIQICKLPDTLLNV